MRPFLAFMAGLLVFSGGGMRGKLGSVIAAFIDPGALVEISAGLNSLAGTPQQANGLNSQGGCNGQNGATGLVFADCDCFAKNNRNSRGYDCSTCDAWTNAQCIATFSQLPSPDICDNCNECFAWKTRCG